MRLTVFGYHVIYKGKPAMHWLFSWLGTQHEDLRVDHVCNTAVGVIVQESWNMFRLL